MNKSRVTSSSNLERDVVRALRKVLRTMSRDGASGYQMVKTETSAGFHIPPAFMIGRGVPRTGLQIFVSACRFDEKLLAKKPDTGGLAVNDLRWFRRRMAGME